MSSAAVTAPPVSLVALPHAPGVAYWVASECDLALHAVSYEDSEGAQQISCRADEVYMDATLAGWNQVGRVELPTGDFIEFYLYTAGSLS